MYIAETATLGKNQYFSVGGPSISQDAYHAQEALAERLAVGAGIVSGLAALALGGWGLTRRMRAMRPTLVALTAGYFLLGVPPLVAGPVLAEGLFAPRNLGGAPSKFISVGGRQIDAGEYARFKSLTMAAGCGLGLVFGAALPAGLVVLVRRRYRQESVAP
jgi:hypothetical protein